MNKKDTARELYQMLDGKKFHLSTNMTPCDRSETIQKIRKALETKEKITVVSTSLIEADVDLDFETVFRELAGLDSILQAGGRCNREGRQQNGDVFIFSTDMKMKGEFQMMTSVMLSAMQGTRYPEALLSAVIRRVKTDSDEEKNYFIKLNAVRAGSIKACLNRKARLSNQKEEITMAWDNSNQNPAYLCGSLSSACARPSAVMPKLDKLSNYHLKKLSPGNQIYYGKLIGQIMNNLESSGFPQTLDMDNQGRFIIGYYQMNQYLYTKKSNQEEG